jgi:hypothetical protein
MLCVGVCLGCRQGEAHAGNDAGLRFFCCPGVLYPERRRRWLARPGRVIHVSRMPPALAPDLRSCGTRQLAPGWPHRDARPLAVSPAGVFAAYHTAQALRSFVAPQVGPSRVVPLAQQGTAHRTGFLPLRHARVFQLIKL